jgi:hypothetical protein
LEQAQSAKAGERWRRRCHHRGMTMIDDICRNAPRSLVPPPRLKLSTCYRCHHDDDDDQRPRK